VLVLIAGAVSYRASGRLSSLLGGCGVAVGIAYGGYQASEALQGRLPTCVDREFREVRIKLVSDPTYRDAGEHRSASARFIARLLEPIADGKCSVGKDLQVALSWYEPPQLRRGDVWQAELRLRPPWGYQNPGGFDYERWLFGEGYQGTGYVRRAQLVSAGEKAPHGGGFRDFLARSDAANVPMIQALAQGDGSAIDTRLWGLFRRTGTVHLMVVSGLHVGLVVAASYWLASLLMRVFPQSIRPSRAAALLALLLAGAFVWSAGMGVPALRAWLMAAAVMLTILLGRRVARAPVFIQVLAVTLLINPLVVHQSGFYLSFAAAGALLWLFPAGSQRLRWPLALLATQLVLFVSLTPLLSLQQSQLAGLGSLSNLLAIPLLSVVLPVILLAALTWSWVPDAAELLLEAADWLLDLLLMLLELFAQAPLLNAGSGSPLFVLFSILAARMLMSDHRSAWCGLLLAGWLVWLVPERSRIPLGEFRVLGLDVGQGSAIVIDTAAHRLLFDTGPGYPGGFNLGEAAVVPSLLRTGSTRINALVLSHADTDHTAGLDPVLSAMAVDRVYASFDPATDMRIERANAFSRCRDGVQWAWDGVKFEFINPEAEVSASDNDRSCVLLVSSEQSRALFSGDIGSRVERRIVHSGIPTVDLLFAPHHGSRSSSSSRWIQATDPDLVIVSAPRRSRYGHPHPEVVKRYQEAAAQVEITGHGGAVVWRSWQSGRLKQWRHGQRAYWLNQPADWSATARRDVESSP
jgi:competence protein ComEC